jgi:hypothetical protein
LLVTKYTLFGIVVKVNQVIDRVTSVLIMKG